MLDGLWIEKRLGGFILSVSSLVAIGMQISHLFDTLDLDHNGSVSWEEFSNFLQRNPEYLAVIMAARPNLLKAPEEP
jgi:lysophosphatidylcholine acyltransferase/lyso-PAF acetyltransferase